MATGECSTLSAHELGAQDDYQPGRSHTELPKPYHLFDGYNKTHEDMNLLCFNGGATVRQQRTLFLPWNSVMYGRVDIT